MELLQNLALGFSVALTLNNIMYCFIGVMLGTLIGVLPGIVIATVWRNMFDDQYGAVNQLIGLIQLADPSVEKAVHDATGRRVLAVNDADAAGFAEVSRPTLRRVVMRIDFEKGTTG